MPAALTGATEASEGLIPAAVIDIVSSSEPGTEQAFSLFAQTSREWSVTSAGGKLTLQAFFTKVN
ncbi:hypothetical protein NtRootA1_18230 [Arthrobacter sp. NtRootA1]|nr:hypothetical protein NtRootA1_18230 [Arthrobacter sp. NtRootA1]